MAEGKSQERSPNGQPGAGSRPDTECTPQNILHIPGVPTCKRGTLRGSRMELSLFCLEVTSICLCSASALKPSPLESRCRCEILF